MMLNRGRAHYREEKNHAARSENSSFHPALMAAVQAIRCLRRPTLDDRGGQFL